MESGSGNVGRGAAGERPIPRRSPLPRLRKRIGALLLVLPGCAVLAAVVAACAGPAVPTPISDEPVCPDFEVGATKSKMRGGLRLPVAVTIKEGKNPVMRTTVYGMRTEKDTPTKILLPDDNEEYTVEWAQCENERAPKPVDDTGTPPPKSTATPRAQPAEYECGKGNVYKTDKLVTKKGDLASHALAFPEPPKTDCWKGEAPAAVADAGATEPAAADASADTAQDAAADASAAATDAATEDASASKPDAGKHDAGKPPAPKPDGGAKKAAPAST